MGISRNIRNGHGFHRVLNAINHGFVLSIFSVGYLLECSCS